MVLTEVNRKQEFLNALKESTRETYRIGLNKCEAYIRTLPEYAGASDPLFEFLRRVKEDRNRDVLDMQFEERRVLKGLFQHLQSHGYAAKSAILTVAALQSFGKYYQVKLSTEYTDAPSAVSVNEKHEWTLEEVGKFIESMELPHYQSLAVSVLQSTLRISDLVGKKFPYSNIKSEFERGVIPLYIPIYNSQKTGVTHRTFLGKLAVEKLKAYFDKHGTPAPDEPVYKFSDRSAEEYFARHAQDMFGSWNESQNPYGIHSIRGAACSFLQEALCPDTAIEYFSGHGLNSDIALRYRRRPVDRWRKFYGLFEWSLDYTLKPEDRPHISIAELKQVIESFVSEPAKEV
jgi:integrase